MKDIKMKIVIKECYFIIEKKILTVFNYKPLKIEIFTIFNKILYDKNGKADNI